ncbi:LacI family DNA-binding transcriptional regulator [Microbacterium sp. HA-8]|uniref:LacI family DNA-binding transcriptional regulator n=1 Tax=Microbacterium sp. HA-8 TaxID=3234200 RepID=UPI0038F65C79
MERRVSMADVAAEAGVSGQTVSRVANGLTNVDPATRARVEAAMQRLGYRPHRAARALRTGRTHTLGVVVATLASVGNTRMLESLVAAAAARGYAVVVASLAVPAANAAPGTVNAAANAVADAANAVADAAFAALAEQGVDGAIVLNEATPAARAANVPAGMPVVAIDSGGDARFLAVESDHAGGAAAATRHLLARGARTVHHVAGPASAYAAAERERGWRAALAEAGIAAPEVRRGDWSAASGHIAGRSLADDPGVQAVFAANDQMALGVLRALHDRGRAVPGEVAVVGFDDVLDAADYWPPLTSVRQDFDALGARAVSALLARVEGRDAVAHDIVATSLIVRESAPGSSR